MYNFEINYGDHKNNWFKRKKNEKLKIQLIE